MDSTSTPGELPDFKLHRDVGEADSAAITDKRLGMNIVGFDTIAVQVVPTLVRPKLRALLWCEEAGQFVACNATAFIEPPYIVPFQINTPKVYNGIMLIEITNADGGPFPMGARVKILMGGLAGQYIPPLPTGGL